MGPGPVTGGKAGDQDYSLSSMLERAPIKKQDEPGEAPATIGFNLVCTEPKTLGLGVFPSVHIP